MTDSCAAPTLDYVPDCSNPYDGKDAADFSYWQGLCEVHGDAPLKRNINYVPDCSKPFDGEPGSADIVYYMMKCENPNTDAPLKRS